MILQNYIISDILHSWRLTLLLCYIWSMNLESRQPFTSWFNTKLKAWHDPMKHLFNMKLVYHSFQLKNFKLVPTSLGRLSGAGGQHTPTTPNSLPRIGFNLSRVFCFLSMTFCFPCSRVLDYKQIVMKFMHLFIIYSAQNKNTFVGWRGCNKNRLHFTKYQFY